MGVHITIEADRGAGKTHLAKALRDFLVDEYPNVGVLDVSIIERTTPENPEPSITGRRFVIHPDRFNLQQVPKEG